MIRILYSGPASKFDAIAAPLRIELERLGLVAQFSHMIPPEDVDYIVFEPSGQLEDFTPFVRTKAVLSLWAGVETIVGNPTLTQPLCRMVESGLSEGMVEWVTGHVLRHHLDLDRTLATQDGVWDHVVPPLARDRRVGVLGLGELGGACAMALRFLKFPVSGWSRTPKTLDGVDTFSGSTGLDRVLERSDILVLLLPRTPATENVIDARALSLMPRGAVILNPGRGHLIDDDALLDALDRGQIAHATLDVFRTEPLPPDHPFWAHPGVTVTPHVASATRDATAARSLAENIRRGEEGAPFLSQVDRVQGY